MYLTVVPTLSCIKGIFDFMPQLLGQCQHFPVIVGRIFRRKCLRSTCDIPVISTEKNQSLVFSESFRVTNDKTHLMTHPAKWHVHPAKPQISLGIRPVLSVFAVHMKKAWVLSYPLSAQRRLIRLGGCPGRYECSLDSQSFCWFCCEVARKCFAFDSK